jgi:adenosylcobinamide hydrolase
MFETTVRDGVCRLRRPGTRWLSTGYAGGESRGPAAYNLTVPEGWTETDLDGYVAGRLARAGFEEAGPALLTGVDQRHARLARLDGVSAVVTAGLSNPAVLPVTDVDRSHHSRESGGFGESEPDEDAPGPADDEQFRPGTVNVLVGTTRALAPGALANLLTVAAEAKAATLVAVSGVPGTTSDAVVAACDPAGETTQFSGSATPVGRAARACVRDGVLASLHSRYPDGEFPRTLDDAPYGVSTDASASVTELDV